MIFRAALSRFAIGVALLVLLPALYPLTARSSWVFLAYLSVAAIEQILIRQRIGGDVRSLVAGIVDVAIITFVVHRLGSVGTVVAAFYFLVCVINVLVVGLRVGIALGALNAVAYASVVWAERFGVLPFAPDAPDVARMGAPTSAQAFLATFLITILIVASTATVGLLVLQLRGRERELVEANDLLAELSLRDPLTNLSNRRHLFAQIEHELERFKRGHALAVVMIDLDRFKHVNDREGHGRGDLLLREIASEIAGTTRASDVAGRYGGDEFVVVLADTRAGEARVAAQRIADVVREAGKRAGTEAAVTASVGIAVAQRDDTVESILRRADENAYRAKREGGDRVVG
jgi:diguanylate cyclase (GGDEF)-like protein